MHQHCHALIGGMSGNPSKPGGVFRRKLEASLFKCAVTHGEI